MTAVEAQLVGVDIEDEVEGSLLGSEENDGSEGLIGVSAVGFVDAARWWLKGVAIGCWRLIVGGLNDEILKWS